MKENKTQSLSIQSLKEGDFTYICSVDVVSKAGYQDHHIVKISILGDDNVTCMDRTNYNKSFTYIINDTFDKVISKPQTSKVKFDPRGLIIYDNFMLGKDRIISLVTEKNDPTINLFTSKKNMPNIIFDDISNYKEFESSCIISISALFSENYEELKKYIERINKDGRFLLSMYTYEAGKKSTVKVQYNDESLINDIKKAITSIANKDVVKITMS